MHESSGKREFYDTVPDKYNNIADMSNQIEFFFPRKNYTKVIALDDMSKSMTFFLRYSIRYKMIIGQSFIDYSHKQIHHSKQIHQGQL